MKKKIPFVFAFFLLPLLFYFGDLREEKKLLSPWNGLGKVANNLWFPGLQAKAESEDKKKILEITAKAAYFIDINSGEILYEKNPHLKVPIASLTKVMTAIIALENYKWDEELEVSSRAAAMEPDAMFLISGEKLTVEELLYGVFLVSGNDAAEVLAEHFQGGREEFIKQMNVRAKQIGMENTLFINPTGLQEDRIQYSTAFDTAIMARYAIKQFPQLVKISSTTHIVLPKTSTHREYDLHSGINLLTTYPGVLGFKTGFTPEAGLTLITFAKRERHEVLGVLLGSENRREEARKLLDYSFQKLGVNI